MLIKGNDMTEEKGKTLILLTKPTLPDGFREDESFVSNEEIPIIDWNEMFSESFDYGTYDNSGKVSISVKKNLDISGNIPKSFKNKTYRLVDPNKTLFEGDQILVVRVLADGQSGFTEFKPRAGSDIGEELKKFAKIKFTLNMDSHRDNYKNFLKTYDSLRPEFDEEYQKLMDTQIANQFQKLKEMLKLPTLSSKDETQAFLEVIKKLIYDIENEIEDDIFQSIMIQMNRTE